MSSTLNKDQTKAITRSDPLSPLPAHFYIKQSVLLLISGLLFLWLSRSESWDMAISQMWYDPLTHRFPWKDNYWMDLINHRLLKDLIIAGGVVLLFAGIARRQGRWILVALLMGFGPLVIGILKATSAHSCPWDLVEFGGHAVTYPLLGAIPENSGPGRCFPGGHASSGFGAMALFFLFYPRRPRLAWFCWWLAFVVGMVMGFGQIMRGAHFLSHNFWAAWWVWLTQCAIFGCVTHLLEKKKRK